MEISDLGKRLAKLTADNSPVIFTAIGVAGALTTAYLTGKATIKAVEVVRQERFQREAPVYVEPSKGDVLKWTWKLYIPPASSAVVTIACIILANRIGSRRAAALAAAYAISERSFAEYKSKVIEKLGEKKEQTVRDEIAQDRVNRNPFDRMIVVGEGQVLCYDSYTGRYFLCDMETIRRAENDINHQVTHDYYASLSDFYNKIGLPPTSMSDDMGWNADKLLEIEYSAVLSETGKPCIAINFRVEPVRGYSRLQ